MGKENDRVVSFIGGIKEAKQMNICEGKENKMKTDAGNTDS